LVPSNSSGIQLKVFKPVATFSSLGSKVKGIDLFSFFAAMFYVYILYSQKYDRYYIGHSPDVDKRLKEHNNPRENK